MKRVLPFTLILSLLSGAAFAHAGLTASTPADGASVAAPSAVSLTFSEAVSLDFTGVVITDAAGNAVTTGAPTLDDAGTTLTVPAALTAGAYAVDWHALSDDGHKSEGSFHFTVK